MGQNLQDWLHVNRRNDHRRFSAPTFEDSTASLDAGSCRRSELESDFSPELLPYGVVQSTDLRPQLRSWITCSWCGPCKVRRPTAVKENKCDVKRRSGLVIR